MDYRATDRLYDRGFAFAGTGIAHLCSIMA
jgi:hypothetical protein